MCSWVIKKEKKKRKQKKKIDFFITNDFMCCVRVFRRVLGCFWKENVDSHN